MSSNKYEMFLKVVDLGSFSRAARELGYTQSTVSQSVIQMETAFGFKLLDRNKKGFSLTPEGEALLPLIRAAAESERQIEENHRKYGYALRLRFEAAEHIGIENIKQHKLKALTQEREEMETRYQLDKQLCPDFHLEMLVRME